MRDAPVPLGVTIGPLGSAIEAMDRAAAWGLAGVQLDASDPGMRPREMGESARRDVAVALRRRGLVASGIDCFVPLARFTDAAQVERAVEAVLGCMALAEPLGRPPVCLHLPGEAAPQATQAMLQESFRRGVPLADFTTGTTAASIGVDPVASLAGGGDPVAEVHRAAGRVVAARVADLLPTGMRGPIGEPAASRLDALAYRLALETAGFRGLPVIDCRQWISVPQGVQVTIDRWMSLLPVQGAAS